MTATEDDTRAAWLEWRREGLGASDMAAIATGKYGGLYGVVAAKLGYHADDIDPQLAERGRRWETTIADAVRVLTGYYVHGEQMLVTSAADPVHRCTLDGLLDPRPEIAGIDDAHAVLEVKTVGVEARPPWDYYRAQCQWQMHVTGKTRAVLAVARIDDTDDTCTGITIAPVERDDFTIGTLVAEAARAWELVTAGELPAPDEHTDVALVREVNGLIERGADTPDLTSHEHDLARYLELRALRKELDAELNGVECRLRDLMGGAIVADTDRYRLRIGEPVWRFTRDSEADALEHLASLSAEAFGAASKTVLDRDAFKANHPDLYEQLKRPTTERRITVKEKTR